MIEPLNVAAAHAIRQGRELSDNERWEELAESMEGWNRLSRAWKRFVSAGAACAGHISRARLRSVAARLDLRDMSGR